MPDAAHEVMVPCDCGDIEACRMELYVSDVRLLLAQWCANPSASPNITAQAPATSSSTSAGPT